MCKTKDTDTNKDQNLDKTPKNKNNQKVSTKFFWFIFGLTVVFAVAQVYNCYTAKERQDRILGILLDSKTVLKSQNTSIIDYSDSSLVDSNFLNKRNSLQSSKKDTVVSSGKISKDSELNISQNIRSTIENVEKLLHLEFAKIQEERNALTLWIGIITVVFLIFSFYSMLKSDDLVKQSKEGLKDIKSIKKDTEKAKEKYDKDLEKWKKDMSDLKKQYDDEFNKIEQKYKENYDKLKEALVPEIKALIAENITNVRAEIENSSSSNEFNNGIDEVQDEEKKLDDYTTNKKSE